MKICWNGDNKSQNTVLSTLFQFTNFRVCEHVDDDIDLPMADLSDILKSDIPREELIKDPTVIDALEEAVMSWERHITKVIESYLAKVIMTNR